MQVSRNLAFDIVRREKTFRDKEPEIAALKVLTETPGDGEVRLSQEFTDDRLRMMFVCCHPVNAPETQVALALKTLCGFSVTEIARAFLTNDAAIAKRLTRARQKIRDAYIPFEIPAGDELTSRLDAVLHTLYLLFNEGYKASMGDKLIREELCQEAIRIAVLLANHPAGNCPKTHAMIALMYFNGARLNSRTDADGNILRLKDQDRFRWDPSMIARGMFHMVQSAVGSEISEYHLQAGIAACHCTAQDYRSTDWPRILSLYDQLYAYDGSPVIALNRAIAIANVHGPAAGLAAVESIPQREKLNSYYLFYAAIGEFESQLNRPQQAVTQFRKALNLADIESERTFLSGQIRACEQLVESST